MHHRHNQSYPYMQPLSLNGVSSNVTYDPDNHSRRSVRLRDYDYAGPGAYFVTLCVHQKECWLGEISGGKMRMNEYGLIVMECWQWLSKQYQYVIVDKWIVMPNHSHGILVIPNDACRGGSRTAPTNANKSKPLGRLIGAFKTVSTKRINIIRGTLGVPFWQRNYYEHVIRNESELNAIRQYIADNPRQWDLDQENLRHR